MKSMLKRAAALALVGVAFAACSDGATDSLAGPEAATTTFNLEAPIPVTVCKVWTDAQAAGDYEFTWALTDGGGSPAGDGGFTLTAGDGVNGANAIAGCADENASALPINVPNGYTLAVTELGAGVTTFLDPALPASVTPFEAGCLLNESEATIISTGTASLTNDAGCTNSEGYLLAFKNIDRDDPPEGGEGCTPGYWRQPHHYGNWTAPYTPDTEFHSVFDGAEFGDDTLGEAIAYNGGGLNALARHAVAALLNAAHPDIDYGYATPADVIAAYNAARTGDRATLNAQKDEFDEFNNAGCELGRAEG